MAGEFSPELNQSVLDALLKRIKEQQAQEEAAARGQAITRGISGSSYEGSRVGAAVRGGEQASADAAIQLAIENATRQREERLIKESQAYQTSERVGSQDFQAGQQKLQNDFVALESEKNAAREMGKLERVAQIQEQQDEIQRKFLASESEKNRLFGADQGAIQREADAMNARRQGRSDLVGAGANLVGLGLLTKGGGLFGTGAPAAAGTGAGAGVAPAGIGARLFSAGGGGGIGGAALTGAGLVGGGYAGQSLAKLTGKNTNEAKAGSAIGAGIGTLFGGPVGAVAGGAVGGLATKAVQGLAKKWCFDGETPIEMADGSLRKIKNIGLGEETKGGNVLSVRASLTDNGTRYNYKGVIVTGSHAVNENGQWLRVEDSTEAKPLAGIGIVYSLVTSSHRIYINNIEFADEHEIDEYEDVTMKESLKIMNQREMKAVA